MTEQLAFTGRVKRTRVSKSAGGMTEGLVWVEAYLPLDVEALAAFVAKAQELGGPELAAEADPELASKALEPIDAHGEAMLPEAVIALAHGYLTDCRKVDVMHDGVARTEVDVVESFVNGPEVESPHFYPGAWVSVLKIDPASQLFADVDAGKLDAVSFQAWVSKVPVTVNLAALSA